MTPWAPLLGRPPREDGRRTGRFAPLSPSGTARRLPDARPEATARPTAGGAV